MTWLRVRPVVVAVLVLPLLATTVACDRRRGAPEAATSRQGTEAPHPSQRIDRLLEAAWASAGVTPAPPADDATYLRRVYLDLTGVVPSVEQVRAFSSDPRPDRRERLVAALLGSDRFAKHWTNYWDDVLLEGGRRQLVDRIAFRQWLYGEHKGELRYDELVRRLLTASGVNSDGGRPSLAAWELDEPPPEGVNGAVNFLLTGAREPQNLAGATARVFLGVQLQCAECHDHPTEKYTQDDFRRFTSAFMRVEGRPVERGRGMGIRRLSVEDAAELTPAVRRRMRRSGYGTHPPTALDGTPLDADNPRQALARWMTAKDNPWFARALVNRMWAYFLGRGFVEPIDDLSPSREVVAEEVLDALTEDFVANDYDLRHLMRTIVSSTAYRRSAAGRAPLFASFALRPMNDTQLLDSLVVATGIEPLLEEVAGERLPRLKLNLRRQFRFTFDVDEDASSDGFTGTTSQALMLLNGAVTAAGSSALEGSTVAAARGEPSVDAAITYLYLGTLARAPASDELEHWREQVTVAATHYRTGKRRAPGTGPVARVYRHKRLSDLNATDVAYEDVLWALLNASEFFFIH